MSSEIDPMVHELIDATRNATQAGGEDNEQWMNETAEHLTARLALVRGDKGMSEIDPQVQYLIDAIVNAPNGKIELTYYREHAESITARLAQPTVTREAIAKAIHDQMDVAIPWESEPDYARQRWFTVADAVMAVIASNTAGGE